MERSLVDDPIDSRSLVVPEGFKLLPWSPTLLKEHSKVKFESFRSEMDSSVFACLGRRDGCLRLMKDLAARSDFTPEATGLAIKPVEKGSKYLSVGTIQGLRTELLHGSIQNLGIAPEFRGKGLGKALLLHSLLGFQQLGCLAVSLEVTSHNTAAIKLYQSMGFRIAQIVYKVAEVQVA